MGSGQVVRVDDELISYKRIDTKGLYECTRGLYGTKISEHKAGSIVSHFVRAYGYHLTDLDTDFIDEIAYNFANLVNRLPIDMIYFDGSELLQGPGMGSEHWYYNARLHKAFFDKLKNKNILFQASSCSPYLWNMITRNASVDGHDDLKAYLEERSADFRSEQNSNSYLDVGWYYAYDRNAILDMYEYCLGATIAYDASFSFQTAVSSARTHPFIGGVLDLINAYEKLRLSGKISDEVKANFKIDSILSGRKSANERRALLGLRKEYCLECNDKGNPYFRRVVYPVWENVGTAKSDLGGVIFNDAVAKDDSYFWNIKVDYESRLGLQVHFKEEGNVPEGAKVIRPLMTVFRVTGNESEKIGEIAMEVELSRGQYAFSLPGKKTTVYGLPLFEPKVIDETNRDLYLLPGEYRIEFQIESGKDLPIRVRTPLYIEELLPISNIGR